MESLRWNNRAIPFNLTANNLQAEVHYISASDHYGATITMNDLRTKMAQEPEVQSKLQLAAEFGRDTAELKTFDFTTGKSTHLTATALVTHFAKPEWQASIRWRAGAEAGWVSGGRRWFHLGHAGPECARAQLRSRAGGGAEEAGVLRAAQGEGEPAAADYVEDAAAGPGLQGWVPGGGRDEDAQGWVCESECAAA